MYESIRSFYAFGTITLLSIFALYYPLISQIYPLLTNTVFSNAIKNSLILKLAQSASIAATIPILFDISLDCFSHIQRKNIIERSVIVMALLIPSLLFFILNDNYISPFLYIILDTSKRLVIGGILICLGSTSSFMSDELIGWYLFFISMILFSLSQILQLYSLVYTDKTDLYLAFNVFYYVSISIFIISIIVWSFKLYGQVKKNRIQADDYKGIVYLFGLVTYIVVCQIFTSFIFPAATWETTGGGLLAFYLFVQVWFTTLVTILPGQIARQLADARGETLNLKRGFVRLVSHEIRSPLSVAHAGLEILQNDLTKSPNDEPIVIDGKMIELVDDIYFSNELAINILNDLLLYENIDAGTFKLDLKRKSIHNLFRGRFRIYFVLSRKNNLSLTIQDQLSLTEFYTYDDNDSESLMAWQPYDISSLHVNIDIHRVDQIIRNLVTNASKFTRSGGSVNMHFSFIINENNNNSFSSVISGKDNAVGHLRISVTDSGAGIVEEDQHKVFGQFVQFNSGELQSGGGSGLGLWICNSIAKAHNGSMGFTSEGTGRGCCFYFDLPVFKNTNETNATLNEANGTVDTPIVRSARKKQSYRVIPIDKEDEHEQQQQVCDLESNETTKRIKILIVDDSEMNRKMVKRVIEKDGVQKNSLLRDAIIMEADDGSTAIEIMDKEIIPFDFVLLDYVMHVIHGPSAAKQMRTELKYNGKIIGITGNGLPEDIQHFLDCGADSVIVKPLTIDKLFDEMFPEF